MTDSIVHLRAWTTLEPRQGSGILYVRGRLGGDRVTLVRCRLEREGNTISEERFTPSDFQEGVSLRDLQVRYWWPHDAGEQPLYVLQVELLDAAGSLLDGATRRVGFKHAVWPAPDGESKAAEPWVCVLNDRPVRLHVAAGGPDVDALKAQGVNVVKLDGPAPEDFYARCDELGLMVWQRVPPAPGGFVGQVQHHVSILLWGGEAEDDLVSTLDPTRRFLATS